MKILVVDDEPELLGYLTRLLAKNGHETVLANHPDVAKEKIDESFDALLTDIEMQGQSVGEELSKDLLKKNPRMLVIYMSGSPTALPLGSIFLAKPFDPNRLLAILQQTAISLCSCSFCEIITSQFKKVIGEQGLKDLKRGYVSPEIAMVCDQFAVLKCQHYLSEKTCWDASQSMTPDSVCITCLMAWLKGRHLICDQFQKCISNPLT